VYLVWSVLARADRKAIFDYISDLSPFRSCRFRSLPDGAVNQMHVGVKLSKVRWSDVVPLRELHAKNSRDEG